MILDLGRIGVVDDTLLILGEMGVLHAVIMILSMKVTNLELG